MNAVSTFESNLVDLVTSIVMVPVAALYGLAWLIWQGCVLLWRCRLPIACALVIAGAVAVCWACPALPPGLAIIAAFGWVTMPRPKSTRRVSWNSFSLKAVPA